MAPPRDVLQSRFMDALIASAQTANHAIALYCPDLKASQEFIAGCWAFFNGAKDPATRAILVTSEQLNDDDLDRLESFFRGRESPVRIFVPDGPPSLDLIDHLCSRGYERGSTLGTWWMPLPAVLSPDSPRVSENLQVVAISPEQAEVWARTVAIGFGETDEANDAVDAIEEWAVRSYVARTTRAGCQSYLATIAGEPAGGGVLEMRNEIALVRTASTRFAYRRKGVQAALIAERLRLASSAGCTMAFSMADRGGASERNLRRSGFQFLQEGRTLWQP